MARCNMRARKNRANWSLGTELSAPFVGAHERKCMPPAAMDLGRRTVVLTADVSAGSCSPFGECYAVSDSSVKQASNRPKGTQPND